MTSASEQPASVTAVAADADETLLRSLSGPTGGGPSSVLLPCYVYDRGGSKEMVADGRAIVVVVHTIVIPNLTLPSPPLLESYVERYWFLR